MPCISRTTANVSRASGAFQTNRAVGSAVAVGTAVAGASALAGLATSTLVGMSLVAGTVSAVSASD